MPADGARRASSAKMRGNLNTSPVKLVAWMKRERNPGSPGRGFCEKVPHSAVLHAGYAAASRKVQLSCCRRPFRNTPANSAG